MCSKHYNLWLPINRPVAAKIVVEHMMRLRAAGFGHRTIADAAGIGCTTVCDIYAGNRIYVYAPTARAILAINTENNRPMRMNPVGAIRRVRALVAHGYTEQQIAAAIEIRQSNLWKYMQGSASWVRPETHDRIDAAFQTLSAQPMPTGWVAQRARNRAASRGWAPPMAWNIETIDDPAASPIVEAIRRPPKLGQVLDDFHVEYLELRDELGLSDAAIAERVGITEETLGKRLSRLRIPSQQSRAAS